MMETVRYSPRPISLYTATVHGVSVGPAQSPFFANDPEAWNLAYLSHDFDALLCHPDPHFSTHVRRTIQVVIETGLPDLTDLASPQNCIRGQLRQPASVAAGFILDRLPPASRDQLPLFKAYGRDWLNTIELRAWKLSGMSESDPLEPFREAIALIRHVQYGLGSEGALF